MLVLLKYCVMIVAAVGIAMGILAGWFISQLPDGDFNYDDATRQARINYMQDVGQIYASYLNLATLGSARTSLKRVDTTQRYIYLDLDADVSMIRSHGEETFLSKVLTGSVVIFCMAGRTNNFSFEHDISLMLSVSAGSQKFGRINFSRENCRALTG